MAFIYEPGLKYTKVLTTIGLLPLNIRSKRVARIVGQYWNAVKYYLDTNEVWMLRQFDGMKIRNRRRWYQLSTSLADIDELYDVGELSFEGIYEVY